MDIKEIESKIIALKAKQSDFFKKKKAERNYQEVEAIRKELNELKQQARKIYRSKTK
ncbi:MAG: hypothetical protein NZM38_08780 [Cytophagales bacterium]|nr:hypothetical protein [Cytophagales bacterium]MDW8384853.1 hypothetical protein [Flammeovirgaceae bacterium]